MPTWIDLTDRVILAIIIIAILYNVAAGMMGGGEATISARLQHHVVRYPIIGVVVGGLVCHWFWPVFGIRE